ncbi:MAG TPA: glycosyltransferase family 39 protein [Tepidisphaeraceae bacterium]
MFLVAVFLQRAGGAYRSEFGGHPDEAAHYVTGLMVHDYLTGGLPGAPMGYAKRYYDHYPKVALGNWPPGFYLLQTAWTAVFSPSRSSVLVLMAALTAGIATILFILIRGYFGWVYGLIGAAAFVAFPLTQRHTAMVMTEVPITLLALISICCFARYVARERAFDAVLFALFASAAIMTKGSGLFLALLPPLAILFTRKFHLLKRRALWCSAAIVVLLCFPWTYRFREEARAGWMEASPSVHFMREAAVFYPERLILGVGFAVAVLAAIGLCVRSRRESGESESSAWSVFAAALLALLLFHATVPCGLEDRHLLPALPLVILFAVSGVEAVSRPFGVRSARAVGGVAMALTIVASIWQVGCVPHKGYQGFSPVAQELVKDSANGNATFLISSDARGEGMFVSEVAMLDNRPGHVVRRASKLLASSTWSGEAYKAQYSFRNSRGEEEKREYKNEDDLERLLLQDTIDFVIVDTSVPDTKRVKHHEMLRRTVEKFPAVFVPCGRYPIQREGAWMDAIFVYRIKRN